MKVRGQNDNNATVRTESTVDSSIVLNSGVTVNGNILIGAGGNPDTVIKDLGATTGHKFGAAPEQLPEISAPTNLTTMSTTISAKGATVAVTPADNGMYDGIALKNSSKATVLEISVGDVVLHVTGDINLGQRSEISVADDATLTLYVDGNINCDESSGVGVKSIRKRPPDSSCTEQPRTLSPSTSKPRANGRELSTPRMRMSSFMQAETLTDP